MRQRTSLPTFTVDKPGLSKFVSRKYLAWAVGTVLFILKMLTAKEWLILTAVFVGGQSVVDAAKMIRGRNE